MAKKQPLTRITDSVGHAPTPNLAAYERDRNMIDEAEEKEAEELLAEATKRVKRHSTQTLDLLEEVRSLRLELGLDLPE